QPPERDVHGLADADVGHLAVAELVQRRADRLALGIEDPSLEGDEDACLQEVASRPRNRCKNSTSRATAATRARAVTECHDAGLRTTILPRGVIFRRLPWRDGKAMGPRRREERTVLGIRGVHPITIWGDFRVAAVPDWGNSLSCTGKIPV